MSLRSDNDTPLTVQNFTTTLHPPPTELQAALCWVSGTDPTGGMEYVTDKAVAENDPSKEKDLAMALLQERANLKDFICQVCGCETKGFFCDGCIFLRDKSTVAAVERTRLPSILFWVEFAARLVLDRGDQ